MDAQIIQVHSFSRLLSNDQVFFEGPRGKEVLRKILYPAHEEDVVAIFFHGIQGEEAMSLKILRNGTKIYYRGERGSEKQYNRTPEDMHGVLHDDLMTLTNERRALSERKAPRRGQEQKPPSFFQETQAACAVESSCFKISLDESSRPVFAATKKIIASHVATSPLQTKVVGVGFNLKNQKAFERTFHRRYRVDCSDDMFSGT